MNQWQIFVLRLTFCYLVDRLCTDETFVPKHVDDIFSSCINASRTVDFKRLGFTFTITVSTEKH